MSFEICRITHAGHHRVRGSRCRGRYVTLVNRGTPDFVEIKGVTFCGGSRSELSMSNVPWHEEVRPHWVPGCSSASALVAYA